METAPLKAEMVIFMGKVILLAFWGCCRITLTAYPARDHTVNSTHHQRRLQRLVCLGQCTGLCSSWLLLCSITGVKSYLAWGDLYLLPSIKNLLCGLHFYDNQDLITELEMYIWTQTDIYTIRAQKETEKCVVCSF